MRQRSLQRDPLQTVRLLRVDQHRRQLGGCRGVLGRGTISANTGLVMSAMTRAIMCVGEVVSARAKGFVR